MSVIVLIVYVNSLSCDILISSGVLLIYIINVNVIVNRNCFWFLLFKKKVFDIVWCEGYGIKFL